MKLLGASVVSVSSGTGTLKDAMNEALRDWVATVDTTFYCIGTVAGPHPYPSMVREFQRIIGDETKEQILEAEGRLPDTIIACIGGGSNAIGIFYPFIEDSEVRLIATEAAGKGVETGLHASSITGGEVGVLHGHKTYLLQDEDGQIQNAFSISAGLDYPGIGPEHAHYHKSKRAEYVPITDDEAVDALLLVQAAAALWFAAGLLLALIFFARSYMRARSADARRRLRVVFFGTALGVAPVAGLILVRNLYPDTQLPGDR